MTHRLMVLAPTAVIYTYRLAGIIWMYRLLMQSGVLKFKSGASI